MSSQSIAAGSELGPENSLKVETRVQIPLGVRNSNRRSAVLLGRPRPSCPPPTHRQIRQVSRTFRVSWALRLPSRASPANESFDRRGFTNPTSRCARRFSVAGRFFVRPARSDHEVLARLTQRVRGIQRAREETRVDLRRTGLEWEGRRELPTHWVQVPGRRGPG